MKIVVQESEALKVLAEALLRYDDPDFPSSFNSGLSVAVDRKVKRILRAAASDQLRFSDPFTQHHVRALRRDRNLSHLLMIPWSDFRILDTQGTVMFIY